MYQVPATGPSAIFREESSGRIQKYGTVIKVVGLLSDPNCGRNRPRLQKRQTGEGFRSISPLENCAYV